MNIQECKQFIASADACGHVPLITGPHGIGKSEITRQYSQENDMHIECLILSLMDTGDMLGMPVTKELGGLTSTVWAAPSWYTNVVNAAWPEHLKLDKLQFVDTEFQEFAISRLKTDGDYIDRADLNKLYCDYYNVPMDRLQLLRQPNVNYLESRRSVIFLDEFNRALMDILNASLQLILDHRLHTHELPIVRGQETLIVAAVNPSDGKYTVQDFDPALYDRFVIGDAEPDLKSWMEWAKEKNVNKIVRDFLLDNQKKFHFTPEDGSKGASPRSWTRLAAYVDRLDKDNPDEIMTHYIKGTIGSSLAAQFILFYNNYDDAMTTKELEKLMKKEIKAAPADTNVEVLAEKITELVAEMDAVRRQEFADTYFESYLKKDTAKQAMPMLMFLYALPLESLSSVLKTLQSDNMEGYTKLAALDKEANGKKLFLKLISNLKNAQ